MATLLSAAAGFGQHVLDIIVRYGLLSGLLVVLAGAGVRFLWNRRARVPTPLRRPPRDLELIPTRFVVSLGLQVPDVMVVVHVVNYLQRPVRLHQLTVSYFHIDQGGAPGLENIPATDYTVPPRDSVEVMCRRPLLDAEARGIAALPPSSHFTATLRAVAKGTAGRKQLEVHLPNYGVGGWVEGLAARP